ncbi:hypothetical protein ACJ73_02400 [Blastomyces percursus]|uniref:Uncharacterized protein n=1 Tax=Blastomyces percursus TaxID=1658174 RepID=A0A1J9QBK1_9EURO|nr:hypothetical protein ACJ73_02400 [Blastomyces percursus]
MNIALPKDLWNLQPCQKLQNTLRLNCQEDKQLELKANFGKLEIRTAMVCHSQLETMKKIWLFYPPMGRTSESLPIVSSKSLVSFRKAFTKVVYIPPGWKHATFTIEPGTFAGINFSSLECLPIMAESLGIHSTMIFRLPGDFSGVFLQYQSGITLFLTDEFESQLLDKVPSSWVCLRRTLWNTAQFQQMLIALMELFCKALGIGTAGKRALCCEKQYHGLYRHIQQHHSLSDLLN